MSSETRMTLYVHRNGLGEAVMMSPMPQEGRKPELGVVIDYGDGRQRWEFPDMQRWRDEQ